MAWADQRFWLRGARAAAVGARVSDRARKAARPGPRVVVSTLLHRLTWDHREPNRASMRKCSLARCKHLWVHIGRFVVLARTLDELVGLGIAALRT
jgi:hypothetical protein